MNPLLIAMLAFLAVSGLVGSVAFVFRDTTRPRRRRGSTC